MHPSFSPGVRRAGLTTPRDPELPLHHDQFPTGGVRCRAMKAVQHPENAGPLHVGKCRYLRPLEAVPRVSEGAMREAQELAVCFQCVIHPSTDPVCTRALADGFIPVLFTALTWGNKLTAKL